MTLAWPLYFTLAVFAPLLLQVFKPQYAAGATSLELLAVAMLVATAIGPVDIVLLMGGRSMWNLFNVVVALGAQPRRSASCSYRRSGSPERRAPGPRRSSSTTSRRSPRSARS